MYGKVQNIRHAPGLTTEQIDQQISELQKEFSANPLKEINPTFLALAPRQDEQPWDAALAKEAFRKVTDYQLDVTLSHADIPRLQQMFDDQREFRDQYAIRKKAEILKRYDRVLVVEGSGHAIRDRAPLELFMGSNKTEQDAIEIVREELSQQ